MKYIIALSLLFSTSLFAEKDDRYIVDPGVQIETGYGLTKMRVSHDMENHHTDFQFKSSRCYKNKVNKYRPQINALIKKGYEFTSTDIYENTIPGTDEKTATFLLTFVMDFLDADEWMRMEATSGNQEEGEIRARPADFLEHKFVHFECELKSDKNINDSKRGKTKKIPADLDTSGPKGSTGKGK